MKAIGITGRVLFAVPFIVFGIFHFMGAGDMAAMMLPEWPAAVFLVYLSGLAMILAGLSIITGVLARLASLLLALLMLFIIISVHLPGMFNEDTMQMSMTMLLKDLSMMGGALILANVFSNR